MKTRINFTIFGILLKPKLMKKFFMILCSVLGVGICTSSGCKDSNKSEIDFSTVPSLDVSRFMGRWYELARYDHKFERGMTHVTATYILKDDGKIEVINEGIRDGVAKKAEGKAKQPDPNDPGKLKVSFFLFFYSDYYILELDPDYNYVVIGSSTDKYLWIMCREKTMPAEVYDGIIQRLQERGYDTSKLQTVEQ